MEALHEKCLCAHTNIQVVFEIYPPACTFKVRRNVARRNGVVVASTFGGGTCCALNMAIPPLRKCQCESTPIRGLKM